MPVDRHHIPTRRSSDLDIQEGEEGWVIIIPAVRRRYEVNILPPNQEPRGENEYLRVAVPTPDLLGAARGDHDCGQPRRQPTVQGQPSIKVVVGQEGCSPLSSETLLSRAACRLINRLSAVSSAAV